MSSYVWAFCVYFGVLFGSLATLLSSLKSLENKACLNRFIVNFLTFQGRSLTPLCSLKSILLNPPCSFKANLIS